MVGLSRLQRRRPGLTEGLAGASGWYYGAGLRRVWARGYRLRPMGGGSHRERKTQSVADGIPTRERGNEWKKPQERVLALSPKRNRLRPMGGGSHRERKTQSVADGIPTRERGNEWKKPQERVLALSPKRNRLRPMGGGSHRERKTQSVADGIPTRERGNEWKKPQERVLALSPKRYRLRPMGGGSHRERKTQSVADGVPTRERGNEAFSSRIVKLRIREVVPELFLCRSDRSVGPTIYGPRLPEWPDGHSRSLRRARTFH